MMCDGGGEHDGCCQVRGGAWMSDAEEWTTEERMRTLFSLCDRVSDAVVGVVKEFLDRVWRVCAGLGCVLPERGTPVPSIVRGEDGSGAVTCKNATVDGVRDRANYFENCLFAPTFLDCMSRKFCLVEAMTELCPTTQPSSTLDLSAEYDE